MIRRTYRFACQVSADAALIRVQDLLSKEGVEYRTANHNIASTRTPIAVISIQPVLYTRKNWTGLNPFVYVSAVEVEFATGDGGVTEVTVRVNRSRAVVCAAGSIAFFGILALAGLEPAAAVVFIGFACAVSLGMAVLLSGHLVKKEIEDCLK